MKKNSLYNSLFIYFFFEYIKSWPEKYSFKFVNTHGNNRNSTLITSNIRIKKIVKNNIKKKNRFRVIFFTFFSFLNDYLHP